MRIDVLTLFPEMFTGPLTESIIKRAREQGRVEIHLWDIRDFAEDKHRITDDYPFGGGAGMVMKAEPVARGLEAVLSAGERAGVPVILLSPQGHLFTQEVAKELAAHPRLVLVCGHYEGIDERVREAGLVTDEISIGDYVLTGGELPAMVIIDAVVRLLPGVLGAPASAVEDSFYHGLLDYPHYTRPAVWRGLAVPEVLLSGNHQAIARWRRKEALRRTLLRRPDLLRRAELSAEDRVILSQLVQEEGVDLKGLLEEG